MAIRTIIEAGDPVLREVSRKVTVFDDRLAGLLADMVQTMRHEDGVGLAAVQVGILRRICIVSPNHDTVYELINPEIIASSGTQINPEGCLSIPGARADVKRPDYVKVKAQDRSGKEFVVEAKGYQATIFCHEIDHLDGILFTDRTVN